MRGSERETVRQRERETERQTDRERERETDGETGRHRETQTDTASCTPTIYGVGAHILCVRQRPVHAARRLQILSAQAIPVCGSLILSLCVSLGRETVPG